MSLARALREEQEEKAEFRRILGTITNSVVADHPDIVDLTAKIAAAEQAYYDARAAAPDIDGYSLGEGLRALQEEIGAKKKSLKGMALKALLAGDTGGETVADAKAELQRLAWREEALREGMSEYHAAAQQLNQDVTTADTRLQGARRNLEHRLLELRYAAAREAAFGARANDRDIVDRFAAPRLKSSSAWYA